MSTEKNYSDENRWVEDTIGATIGAATGAGISAVVGLATPAIVAIVPFGLIIGSVAGVVIKELELRKHRLERMDKNNKSGT